MDNKQNEKTEKSLEAYDVNLGTEREPHIDKTFVDDEIVAIRAEDPEKRDAGKSNFEKKGAREEGTLTIPQYPVKEGPDGSSYTHHVKMKEQDFDPTEYPKSGIINDTIITESLPDDDSECAGKESRK